MAEYWKSTPKYLCKDCNVYVRDTKLERANHDATSRHKYGRQRTLREMHKRHEREGWEKERARREVERVNGVVAGSGSAGSGSRPAGGGSSGYRPPNTNTNNPNTTAIGQNGRNIGGGTTEQLEQLVAMGVEIPEDLRGNMAMVGEWTTVPGSKTTKTTVGGVPSGGGGGGVEGIAIGTSRGHKRNLATAAADDSEEEGKREVEEAARGLFKMRKKGWGNTGGGKSGGRDPFAERDGERELDGLLQGFDRGGEKMEEDESKVAVKEEEEKEEEEKEEEGKVDEVDEVDENKDPRYEEETHPVDEVTGEGEESKVNVKKEEGGGGEGKKIDIGDLPPVKNEISSRHGEDVPVVVFKKRKPKNNVRQR